MADAKTCWDWHGFLQSVRCWHPCLSDKNHTSMSLVHVCIVAGLSVQGTNVRGAVAPTWSAFSMPNRLQGTGNDIIIRF
jgi:hypothetical protein